MCFSLLLLVRLETATDPAAPSYVRRRLSIGRPSTTLNPASTNVPQTRRTYLPKSTQTRTPRCHECVPARAAAPAWTRVHEARARVPHRTAPHARTSICPVSNGAPLRICYPAAPSFARGSRRSAGQTPCAVAGGLTGAGGRWKSGAVGLRTALMGLFGYLDQFTPSGLSVAAVSAGVLSIHTADSALFLTFFRVCNVWHCRNYFALCVSSYTTGIR